MRSPKIEAVRQQARSHIEYRTQQVLRVYKEKAVNERKGANQSIFNLQQINSSIAVPNAPAPQAKKTISTIATQTDISLPVQTQIQLMVKFFTSSD